MNWPEWWNWELEITPHVEKRMVQRSFSEVELREMLYRAKALRLDKEVGRYVVVATLNATNWEIILEPDFDEKSIVIVTAYPIKD